MDEFQAYTINTSMESGKNDPKFGTEFLVKFAEVADTFKLWFQKKPEDGSKIEGKIVQGQYGPQFKKKPRDFSGANFNKDAKGNEAPRSYGAQQANREDGMKQGMCVNNAANYIKETATDSLSAHDWADLVYEYACALYSKGDLVTTSEESATVKQLFGQ